MFLIIVCLDYYILTEMLSQEMCSPHSASPMWCWWHSVRAPTRRYPLTLLLDCLTHWATYADEEEEAEWLPTFLNSLNHSEHIQTSQYLLSFYILLMRACVFAQGCMNNLTFGDEHMGYYETIAGGGGAGPTWNGQHGICLHILSSHTLTLPNTYIVMLRQCSNERGVQMNATLSCTHLCMLLVYATIRPLKWPSWYSPHTPSHTEIQRLTKTPFFRIPGNDKKYI